MRNKKIQLPKNSQIICRFDYLEGELKISRAKPVNRKRENKDLPLTLPRAPS